MIAQLNVSARMIGRQIRPFANVIGTHESHLRVPRPRLAVVTDTRRHVGDQNDGLVNFTSGISHADQL